MTLALDGSTATAGGLSLGVTPPAKATLSTTNGGDLVVVACFAETNNHGNPAVTGVTSLPQGLSFSNRSNVLYTPAGQGVLSVWTASAGAALSSEVISVALTPAGSGIDGWAIVAFGVSGASLSAPFDPNNSIPASSTPPSGTKPATTISTSLVHDMLLAFFGADQNNPADVNAIPTGFTKINSAGQSAGGLSSEISAAYQIVSALQTGIGITWGVTNGVSILITDAITADGTPPPIGGYLPYIESWT